LLQSHILALISIKPFASLNMDHKAGRGTSRAAPDFKPDILNIRS